MAVKSEGVADIAALLHSACLAQGLDKIWTQSELLGLEVIPDNDVNTLSECINQLQNENAFKQLDKGRTVCWKVVSREDAAKYENLSQDEALVYSQIESAGRDGIWIKIIRARTNLHQVPANKALKTLEGKGLIKQIRGNTTAVRRIYMLASLQPYEGVSGGPFFQDGELDAFFIQSACVLLEKEIVRKSWHQHQRVKRQRVSIAEEAGGRHRSRSTYEPSTHSHESHSRYLPMPPGFNRYPTLSHLTQHFNDSSLSPKCKLKEDEVSQLLDLLRWEGKIEKVRGDTAYRSVRPDGGQPGVRPSDAYVEVPCGRCPVADFCDDEGPVNAKTCTYFDEWVSKIE